VTLHDQSLIKAAIAVAPIEICEARPEDAETAGRIAYEAFRAFHESRGFPCDFPSAEVATGLVRAFIADPKVFGVVATQNGAIVGSNFLSEGDSVRGVGPISVDPSVQNTGVGRLLMQAVIERGRNALGIRLVQDAFNDKTMALYTNLGFDPREPLAVMTGKPNGRIPAGFRVRHMTPDDLRDVNALSLKVHGFTRNADVVSALAEDQPLVLERFGRITAYMTRPTLWLLNHAVAESDVDLRALIRGAGVLIERPLGFLMPIRRASLFRWALEQGMRVVKPMTLMSSGHYSEPNGAWLPSVLY
jgi:predicted N-acetyltransferase YhbS